MRLIRLLLIFLIMFSLFATGCISVSTIMRGAPSKPLPAAISCRENERLIVQLPKIKSPIVFDMEKTKMTSLGSTTPISTPYGWVYINIPSTHETKDYGPEFKQQHDNAFRYANLQELLLSHMQKNLNTSSSCPHVYITSDDLKQFPFLPSDRVIRVGMTCMYHGSRPVLTARMDWRLLTNAVNIPIIENKEEEFKKMTINLNDSMAAGKSISYSRARAIGQEITQKQNEILSYYDAYGTIVYDSPVYSQKAWFEDNGKLVKQETDKALDELARQLAIALFPGERDANDGPAIQGIASPPSTTPQPSTALQPSLSPPPQPQEPSVSARDDRGTISITSDPPGAKIFIDGEFKGQTPAEISLNCGTYQLFLEHQLYEPYKDSIMIEKGQNKTLNIKLVLAIGSAESVEQKSTIEDKGKNISIPLTGERFLLSKEKPQLVESLPPGVIEGALTIVKEVDKEGNLIIDDSFAKVEATDNICFFCAETIKIAPELTIPLGSTESIIGNIYFKSENSVTQTDFMGKPIEKITFLEGLKATIAPPHNFTELIVSGPKGATIKRIKDGKDILLIDGEAYFLKRKQ